MIRNDDFEKRLAEHAAHTGSFRPGLHYDPDGDCLEFVAAPDDFYAERIDELLTVYYSRRTGDVCGALLKGWSKFQKDVLKRFPGFVIEVQDGKVPLVLVFRARLWSQPPNEIPGLAYKKLIDVAINTDVEAEMRTA